MNRWPDMLTMMEPGELRSDNANHGAPTSGTVGPHHASSMMSNAAPSFSAARMPSPVLAFAPTVHSVVIGARWYLTRICSLCSNPAAAENHPLSGPNQLRLTGFRLSGVAHVDTADRAVLKVEVGQGGVELHRDAGLAQPDPKRRDQRASHADNVLAGRLRPHGACADLEAAQHTSRMPLELVQPHVVLLHHNDVERDLAVRRLQPGQIGTELVGVERLRLDGTATRPAAWGLGVVVGIPGHPAHLQRRVFQHE